MPTNNKAGAAPNREEVDCLLCGPAAEKTLFWQDSEHSRILRCQRCGLAFRSPRRREEEQTRTFAEKWTEGREAFYLEAYRRRHLNRILAWILRHHPEPGTILDIGSSYGTFLAQFPATWRRFGVEPSRLACQVAQARVPEARIITGTLNNADLPEGIFDVITMIDTIYYLPRPRRDLAQLPGLLKPKGTLLIEAPNFANRGPLYRWRQHPFGEHFLYFYTPKNLEKILNQMGMEVVDRLDLPGHQTGSRNIWARAMTWAEYAITKAAQKLSGGRVDLVPHFVLVAQKRAPRDQEA